MSSPRPAAGLIHWIGRQLTRVGALCQKLRLLAAAEASFRAAIRVEANLAWCARLARIQGARRRWAAADATYTRCLELADQSPDDQPRRAGLHHQQGRVRAARKDWDGAEAAFAEALRLRPEVAGWHAHQAEAREGRSDWSGAADSYRAALERESDRPGWLAALVRAYAKAGRPDQAVRAGAGGLDRFPGHQPLIRALADSYQSTGDWAAAAGLLRGLVASRPADRALRHQLAGCLDQLHRVPPGLTGGGTATAGQPGGRADGVVDELAGHLRRLSKQLPRRPQDAFRLGLFYERTGRFAEAAESYRLAMNRLATVDSSWCHKAAYDWEFRLAYVREQLAPATPPPAQRQLRRRVVPVTGPASGAQPAGYFDALIAREGLQLSGFLRPGAGETVDIYVDDQLLKPVRVNAASWRPTFRFDPSPGLLGDLPERSRLAIRVGDRPLVTTGGGTELEVRVPGGTGKLSRKLASGLAPNKKGSWPPRGNRLAARRERYLDLYDRARPFLEGQGRRLFLTYGTLLGCERTGGFITGDDDFDVSYVSHAPDPRRFRRECRQVALALIRQGLDIRFAINGRMLQFGLENVWIDLSPTWFYQGRAWSFVAHDLALDSVEPVRVGSFEGRTVYLPRDSPAFLAGAYGPAWRTPQADFRHYRSTADNQVLSQMWAKPSEVREFARLVGAERRRRGTAGRFVGVGGTPAYPGFNWLTPAPDERRPAAAPGEPAMAAGDLAAGGR